MRILRLDPGDDHAIRGCFEVREAVREAVRAADDPFRPPESPRVFRAAASGRTILAGAVPEGSAGQAWVRRLGATLGDADVRRVQDLRKVQDGAVAWLRASAVRAAAGYSLVHWVGVTPEGYLGHRAALQNAMNDAPHRDGVEPHAWDAGQIRERFDAWVASSAPPPVLGYAVAGHPYRAVELPVLSQ